MEKIKESIALRFYFYIALFPIVLIFLPNEWGYLFLYITVIDLFFVKLAEARVLSVIRRLGKIGDRSALIELSNDIISGWYFPRDFKESIRILAVIAEIE